VVEDPGARQPLHLARREHVVPSKAKRW
jgi:hypothetical protein